MFKNKMKAVFFFCSFCVLFCFVCCSTWLHSSSFKNHDLVNWNLISGKIRTLGRCRDQMLWFWWKSTVFTAKKLICKMKAQKRPHMYVRCSQPGVKHTLFVFLDQPPPCLTSPSCRPSFFSSSSTKESDGDNRRLIITMKLSWFSAPLGAVGQAAAAFKIVLSFRGKQSCGLQTCQCSPALLWAAAECVCISFSVCACVGGSLKIFGECIFSTCVCFSTAIKVCINCLGPFLLRFNLNQVFVCFGFFFNSALKLNLKWMLMGSHRC